MINLIKRLFSRRKIDLSFNEAIEILDDVPQENRFWCCNGQVLNNLYELEISLAGMSDQVFNHHVTDERNDFSSWVKDVVGDNELARRLNKAGTRAKAAEIVTSRIDQIESINLL